MARLVTETDRAIIRLLQRNARISYAEVSRVTGIPESTVRRRMDRLQQRGVIEFTMLADPARLGYDLRAMVGLRVDLGRIEAIAAELRGMDEIIFAAFVTGNFDVMAQVVVRSQEALVDFLTRRLAAVAGIRSTETFIMPLVIKPITSWMLPEPDQGQLAAEARGMLDLDGEEDGDLPASVPAEGATGSRRRGRGRRTGG